MKEKNKPDLSKESLGINPFSEWLEVLVTKRLKSTINKFGEEDFKEIEFEATPYTKIFGVECARKQVCELPIRSKEMYLDMIHAVISGQDALWIDRDDYMSRMNITSINTYKAAIVGLTKNAYIAKHDTLKDVFWINPKYFFRGSRLNKYPKRIIVKNTVNDK